MKLLCKTRLDGLAFANCVAGSQARRVAASSDVPLVVKHVRLDWS